MELPFSNHNDVHLSKIELRVPHDLKIVNGLIKILVYTDQFVDNMSMVFCET